jgi:hypothetical protein
MAREVFTLAGQVIGYSIGGPFGAFVGSFIGAQVGAAVDPLDPQYGPRLEDRRVQSSAYGQQVPLLYGVTRVAGNVIWAEDLEEVQNSEDVGGKGGPSQEVISYSYYCSFAVLLCRGPIRGIRRIWADTILLYDNTLSMDNPAIDQQVQFTLYTGTEDQQPDPVIEAAVGVGDTPAYRGYSYVVFERLPLERFGNRIPSLTFEVNGDGQFYDDLPIDYLGNASHTWRWQFMRQRSDGQLILGRFGSGAFNMAIADPTTGEISLSQSYDPSSFHPSFSSFGVEDIVYVSPTNELWLLARWLNSGVSPSTFESYIVRLSAETLLPVADPIEASNGVAGIRGKVGYYDVYANAVNTIATSQFSGQQFQQFDLDGNLVNEPVDGYDWFGESVIYGGEFFFIATGLYWFAALQNKGTEQVQYDGDGLPVITYVGQGTILAAEDTADIATTGCYDSKRKRYVVIGEAGSVWTVNDEASPTIVYQGQLDYDAMAAGSYPCVYHAELDVIVILSFDLCAFNAETFEREVAIDIPYDVDTVKHDIRVSSNNPNSILVAGAQDATSGRLYEVKLFATTVGAAVASMCRESGYSIADYDVSELTDILRGFRVMRLGPLRQAIEQLGAVFHFDGCEQDDQLVFKKRGRASSATYALEDLVVESPQDLPLKSSRAQESSLPQRLTLTAPDPYTDHQPGAQQAERWTVPAGQDEQVAVDVVLSADEAKQAADALMFDRWVSRIAVSFRLGTQAMRLTYGDVVTVDGRRYRIVGRNTELFTISFEAIADDPDVYTQTASGAQGSFPGQTVDFVVSSGMVIVDSALLRTADDSVAAYAAVYPIGSPTSWRGAVAYSSVDSGANWASEAVMPRPGTTYGTAANALGDFDGGAVFDEVNTLTVAMRNGVPSSSTRAALLNSDANAAAVRSGATWEIIQYRTVTNNGDGTYTLTGLLRGRRGTEHAISGHAIGNDFVVLDPATIRNIEIDNGQLGVELRYKPVTVRQQIADAAYQLATINGVRLKPWAPVDLRAERNTTNSDIVYTWKRRSRWQTRFTGGLGINVPESEAVEQYTVEVYSSSASPTFVRTTTVTDPTWTYTTAMQTADGHTLGSAATIKVYQMSAVVGRGYPLEDTK